MTLGVFCKFWTVSFCSTTKTRATRQHLTPTCLWGVTQKTHILVIFFSISWMFNQCVMDCYDFLQGKSDLHWIREQHYCSSTEKNPMLLFVDTDLTWGYYHRPSTAESLLCILSFLTNDRKMLDSFIVHHFGTDGNISTTTGWIVTTS